MLTVKKIESAGNESVFEAKTVEFLSHIFNEDGIEKIDNKKLIFEMPDGWHRPFTKGTFYIMNDQGNTIAKYFLGV